jgi:hypothetical protein
MWDNVSAYDTLFWFGAVPGDQWRAPGWPDDGNILLTVVDTATVVIDGVPLRRLVVEPFPGSPPVDTLYERIGGRFLYLNGWTWFTLDMPWNGLMCYSDQDIDYAAPGVSDCGFTLSIMDGAEMRDASAFPNPGAEHFTLKLPAGVHIITLFDATGRLVLRQRTADTRPVILTEALPEGLYRIIVHGAHGRPMGASWVKDR